VSEPLLPSVELDALGLEQDQREEELVRRADEREQCGGHDARRE
jgi:hypothetical protein